MKQLLHNATITDANDTLKGWLLISDGIIEAIGCGDAPARLIDDETVSVTDCEGDIIMPGVIDTHVHFRDPGLTDKGDIASESRAAVAGGVTSYIDMPNTKPATTTIKAWNEKMNRAADVSVANYAFFLGATNDNLDELLAADYSRVPGIKLFLGSSTGNMLVDNDDMLSRLFAQSPAVIAVHAEDEATIKANRATIESRYPQGEVPIELHSVLRDRTACYKSSKHAVDMARRHGARLHLLHISTLEELELLEPGDTATKRITAETCPHYLIFNEGEYLAKGARVKCNPAIKADTDRQALLRAVKEGLVDTIATDHAPHLPAHNEGDLFTAASGMPGVQFSLPVMLSLGIDLRTVSRLMSGNPAALYGIAGRGYIKEGFAADLVRVKTLDTSVAITDNDVISKCGWTPYDGTRVNHRVITTWVNGGIAFDNGTLSDRSYATPLSFEHN